MTVAAADDRTRISKRAGKGATSGGLHKSRKPVQIRAEQTRGRILQCARDVFAEKGFSAANVRDIAAAAGTTHSMITYHFGGKEELWREAVRDMFALLESEVVAPVAAEEDISDDERLRKMIRLYTRYSAEHPEHARITVSETIAGGARLAWMVEEFVKANHAASHGVLVSLIERGIVPEMPLASLFYAMVGMIQLPFVLEKEAKLAMGYDFMTDEAIERHAQAVIDLLMPGANSRK